MSKKSERLIWIDLEMTGLDPDRCHILEIATVVTDGQLELVAEGPNLVVHQDEAALTTLSDWSRERFTASGLLDRVRASQIDLAEAEALTLAFVQEHCRPRQSPLCGNSVHTDRSFLRRGMPELYEFLHYRNIDVSSVKELVKRWYPKRYDPPKKTGSHEALADILESVRELAYYRETFFVEP